MTESKEVSAEASPKRAGFDLKDLEQRLIAKGLPALEGLAKEVVLEVFAWAEDGVKASDSKVDDFALAVMPPLKSFIISKLEGISK